MIRRFNPKSWASLSFGYGLGGQSIVNNQSNNDERSNLLGSLVLGYSLTKKQAVKVAFLRLETLKDIGSDTNTFVLSWSTVF